MRKIFILICTITLYSCNSKNEKEGLKKENLKELKIDYSNIQTISINPEKKNNIKLSKLIDTCFAISLQTKKVNLIGSVDEIKIYEGRIYILDRFKASKVFVFDMQGKYLKTIGNKGRGPGEYIRPDGFEIDKKNEEYLIFNGAVKKILRYDFSGNFLGGIDMKIDFLDFKVQQNGNFALLAGDSENNHLGELKNKEIYVTNKNLDILSFSQDNSYFKDVKYTLLANQMTQNNNIVSYAYKLSDTILNLSDKGLFAQYKLDFGNYAIDKEKLHKENTSTFFKKLKKEKSKAAYFMGNHFQTKDYLYFSYNFKNRNHSCFYNKNQSKLLQGKRINDKKDKFWFYPIKGVYDNYFIVPANTVDILYLGSLLEKKNPNSYKAYLKLFNKNNDKLNFKETDNPVLIFYKFKKEYHEE